MSCGPKIKKAQIPRKMKNQRKLKDLWSKQWNLLGRSSTGGFYVHKGLSGVFTWDTAPVFWTVEHLSAKTCRKEKVVLRSGGEIYAFYTMKITIQHFAQGWPDTSKEDDSLAQNSDSYI